MDGHKDVRSDDTSWSACAAARQPIYFSQTRLDIVMAVLSVAKIISRRGPIVQLRMGIASIRSIRQAARMPGCIEAIGAPMANGVAFAVSLWEDEASLKAYVRSGAHGKAVAATKDLARTHVSAHIPWEGDTLPPWTEWGDVLRHGPHIIDTKYVGDLTEEEKMAGPVRPSRMSLRAKVRS